MDIFSNTRTNSNTRLISLLPLSLNLMFEYFPKKNYLKYIIKGLNLN